MATEETSVVPNPVGVTASKKRGPKSRADIEAEIREELEQKIRAEMEAEAEKVKAEERRIREDAARAEPVRGLDLSGDPTVDGARTIHFVTDGFTVLGKVWFYGEELTIVPGTPQWEESSAILSLDEYEQEAKWGKRIYRDGPWRGARLDEIDTTELTEEEVRQLKKAQAKLDAKYGRGQVHAVNI